MPNVPNYAREMDKVLQSLEGRRPRLLLHACCGPCSSAVLEQLCPYFEITVLYYNPNIWPPTEYRRREDELERFVAEAHPLGVKVVEDRYDPQEFYDAARGLENEPERGARCTACYRLRMRRAAEYAAANGFDWFTTTLSISPPQGRRPDQPDRAGAGRRLRRAPSPLGFQEEKRLPALPAAVGPVRPVPAGLLRVRVQRPQRRAVT